MQTLRTHTLRTVITGAAAAALGLASAGPGLATEPEDGERADHVVAAAAVPGFLEPGDLPPHPTTWHAGDVTAGVPDPAAFCLAGALPVETSYYREFQTELDTNATQLATVTDSAAEAGRLAGSLERRVADCASAWLAEHPGGTASWQDYGPLETGDGAHLYGVHTSVPDSEPGVHLFGIGRDGKRVTVARWGEIGDLGQAPVKAFAATTKTAVEKLN